MNAGFYREGHAASDLPLPRTRLAMLPRAIALLAALAIVTPATLLLLGCHSPGGVRTALVEGGAVTALLVLGLAVAVPVMLGVLGGRLARGRQASLGLLAVLAALPFLIGNLGHWAALRLVHLAVEALEPDAKLLIVVAGVGESMWADVLSGFVACAAAIVACAAAASGAATIDAARALRAAPGNAGLARTAVAGGAWLVASLVLALLRVETSGPVVFFPVVAVVLMLPFALLATHGAAGLAGSTVPDEARRTLGGLLVALACAALAMILFERAAHVMVAAKALDAISALPGGDPQRGHILADAVEARRLDTVALVVEGALGAITFGSALLSGLGGGRRPAPAGLLVTCALAAPLALSAVLVEHAGEAMVRESAKELGDVPTVEGELAHREPTRHYADHFVLHLEADHHRMTYPRDERGCGLATPRIKIHADRDATAKALSDLLRQGACVDPALEIVVRHERDAALAPQLGAMGVYLQGTRTVDAVEVRGAAKVPDALVVRVIANDALEIGGVRTPYPLPPGRRPEHADALHFVFRPTDTMERIVRTVASVEVAIGAVSDVSMDLGVPLPPLPVAPTPEPSPEHTGRLDPDVLRRVLRGHTATFRRCYEAGLAKDPTLEGRLTLALVIDPTGAVTSAEDTPPFADRAVAACVLRHARTVVFPAPQGGSLSVVYPLVFATVK